MSTERDINGRSQAVALSKVAEALERIAAALERVAEHLESEARPPLKPWEES